MVTLLARKSQAHIGSALEKYDLSAAEQPFFMALQHHEGITQEQLTAIVCVDKAATARAVRSLEEKGYLVRRQDETDRRQNRIYPTEAAKRLGPMVKKELLRFNDQLTRGIRPEELDIISSCLQTMEENLAAAADRKAGSAEQGGQRDGARK